MLDDVFAVPDRPTKDMVADFETDKLRQAREALEAKGAAEGYALVDKLIASAGLAAAGPQALRLWKLVADAALSALELTTADKALVRGGD